MKEVRINVENKIASAVGSPVIVCGNSNYKIIFNLDAEWGAYQEKTARFTFKRDGIERYIDVLFSGNSCTAPILNNIERVRIGVYAGDLRTTTGAEIRCRKSILCGGKKHEKPQEDVYNEILEIVGKKLGSEGGTVTGEYYKDGNTFIHEGNLDLIDEHSSITASASGSAITIESSQAPLQNLKLYGTDSGSVTFEMYGKNLLDVAKSIPFTNADMVFKNVKCPLKKDETYTLSFFSTIGGANAQFTYTGVSGTDYKSSTFQTVSVQKTVYTFTPVEDIDVVRLYINGTGYIHECMIEKGASLTGYKECNKQTLTVSQLYRKDNVKDEIDFAKGIKIQRINGETVLETPIEIPLTETELNAYRQLYTNKGTTTILSECEDTEVTYYVNKPNAQAVGNIHTQINKDYLKLQQAIISTGGSTL